MAALRPRTHFAAPFIVVLGCGGAQRTPEPPDVPGPKWTVSGSGEECSAHVPMGHCPKGALCNPPPPRPIECPAGLTGTGSVRVVQRPDATCGVIPDGCSELACVTQTTPCPLDYNAPRKLVGTSYQVMRSGDACFARVDACAATDPACAQAIECPVSLETSLRIAESRGQCVIVPEGCADMSCAKTTTPCPRPVGKDLPGLKWIGRREGNTCFVKSTGPIQGEHEDQIACPNDPKKSDKFQIDRATRAEDCVYRAGTAPAVTTPCPP